jgi:HSF-type DNA-binding
MARRAVLPAASLCVQTSSRDPRALNEASRFLTSNADLMFESSSSYVRYLAAQRQSRLALREALNLHLSLDWMATRPPAHAPPHSVSLSPSQLLHLINVQAREMVVDVGRDRREALFRDPRIDAMLSISTCPLLPACSVPASASSAQASSLRCSSSPPPATPTPLSRSTLDLTKCKTKRDTIKVLKLAGSSPRVTNDPYIDVVTLPHLDAVCAERSTLDDDTLFPDRLCAALASAERGGFCDVVAWCHHGRAFQIRDRRRFLTEIMPRYFSSMGSWSSFTRQLSFWGFARARVGVDAGCYYHELMVRGLNLTGYVTRRQFLIRQTTIEILAILLPKESHMRLSHLQLHAARRTPVVEGGTNSQAPNREQPRRAGSPRL